MPLPKSPAEWPPVAAVILDMDGLLIDTEPVWRAAEASVFAAFGIQLSEAELEELLDPAAMTEPSASRLGAGG